jgi:hypothetical protein
MHTPRFVSAVLVATTLALGCADSSGPTAPEDVSFARGGERGAPARNSLLAGMPVSGTLADGGALTGVLSITSLEHDGSQLLASGTLTYTSAGTQTTQTFEDVPATLVRGSIGTTAAPMTASSAAPCDILLLDLGPIFLDLLGLTVDLSQVVLDIDAVRGAGNLLGNLLCAVTGLLDGGGIFAGIANLLDRINDVLDDIGGIITDVGGVLAGGAAFDGSATIASIEQTANGIEVTGVLDGIVTLADGTTREITGQAFTTTATLTRSAPGATTMEGMMSASRPVCDVLLLDLGPIFLDLLGLQVDLSQVVLDIDAVSGAGNLLGNLLCAVTGLLDGVTLFDTLLDRINQLLGQL